MIELKNIVKKYHDKYALNDINFTIEKGEIVGLIRPNGAGKSTTMNIITGYIEQTSGDVIVNGFDTLRNPKKAKKCIGYMPEMVPVYADMTVNEFVRFMAQLHGVKKKDLKEAVYKALEDVGALEVATSLCKNISKGFRQRVSLAGAIVHRPEILILDEPTVGLDPKQIIEIRKLIKKIGKDNTVIISSHILSEVSQICDRVLVLDHGKLVTMDTPENIENYDVENELLVTVEDNEQIVEDVLKKLDYIKEYKVLSSENNTMKIHVIPKQKNDIRKKLVKDLSSNEIIILEVTKQKDSLEEAFIKLVGNGVK